MQKLSRILNVLWGQIIVALIAFTSIRIYTELLDKSEFGKAMLMLGAIAFLDSIAGMALGQTLMSRCGPIRDKELRRQLSLGLGTLAFSAVVGIFLILTIILFMTSALGLSEWQTLFLVPIIILYLGAEFLKQTALTLEILDRHYGRTSIWMAGDATVTLICSTVVLWLWRVDAIGLFAGYLAGRAIGAALFIGVLTPRHVRRFSISHARAEWLEALAYGIPISLMGPLGWISTYVDRYIIAALLGTVATGTYAAATGMVARPYALTTSVLSNYFRPLYYLPELERDGAKGRRRILLNWLASSLAIGGLGAMAFLMLGPWIAQMLLAPDYREGAPLLMALLALSQTFAITTHSADNAVLALRGSKKLLSVQIGLSVVTLILIPVGILLGGVVGGLGGRITAEAIKLLVTWRLSLRMIADHESNSRQGTKA